MKCILHIGTEKTGSSSLQGFLTGNLLTLRKKGFLYPKSVMNAHYYKESKLILHSPLAAYSLEDDDIQDIHLYNGVPDRLSVAEFRKDIENKLREEIAGFAGHTIIFSSEHLSSRLVNHGAVRRLRNFLGEHCTSFQVVVYIRHQCDMYYATLNSTVRSGGTIDFAEPPPQGLWADRRYDYRQTLSLWGEVFGYDNLVVREYDKNRLKFGDICGDFASFFKLDFLLNKSAPARNRSYGQTKLCFINRLNRTLPLKRNNHLNPFRLKLGFYLDDIAVEDAPVPRVLPRKHLAHFKKINKELSKTYFNGEGLFQSAATRWSKKGLSGLTLDNMEDVFQLFSGTLRARASDSLIEFNTLLLKHEPAKLDDCIARSRQHILFFPEYHKLHNHLAELLIRKGALDGALEACRDALDLSPNEPDYLFTLSKILADKGDLAGAVEEISFAIDLFDSEISYYEHLAALYMKQENHAAAQDALEALSTLRALG